MMYTPSPPSKRPRPPSSAAHLRLRKTSLTAATSQPLAAMGLSSMESDRTLSDGAGPSGARVDLAAQQAEMGEGRSLDMDGKVSASPESEAAEVSFALDGLPNRTLSTSTSRRTLRPAPLALSDGTRGQGITPAQASPPPPYGQDHRIRHDDASPEQNRPSGKIGHSGTPPSQDSGHPSWQTSGTPNLGGDLDIQSEERLRQRRAADAARAMGLVIDFGTSSAASASGDESDDMTGSQVKQQLRDAKQKLKQRDRELITAAQVAQRVLERYEALVSRLSPDARKRLPSFLDLLASQTPVPSKSRSGSTVTPRPSHKRQASNRSIMSVGSMTSPTSPLSIDGRCLSPETISPPSNPAGLRTLRIVEGLSMNARPRRVGLSKRTVRSSDSALEQELYYAQLQQADMDARIAELESALAEAQEGQEAQRRAAARLRRENEMVHRNLARAEGLLAESSTLRGIPLPSNRASRGDKAVEDKERTWKGSRQRDSSGSRARSDENKDQNSRTNSIMEDFIDSIANRQPYTSLSSDAGERDQQQLRSRSTSPMLSDLSPSSKSTIRLATHSHRSTSQVTPHLMEPRRVRKKVSPSAFHSPARPLTLKPSSASASSSARRVITPQVKIDPPESDPPSPFRLRRLSHKSSRSSLSSVRSQRERLRPASRPWSPAGSVTSMTSLASRLSASPGYASVSSRMASMRQYVAKHLGTARTLGSELGSNWGGPSPVSSRLRMGNNLSAHDGGHPRDSQGFTNQQDADETEWEDEEHDYIPDEEVAYLESLLRDVEGGGHSEADEGDGEGWPASSPAMLPPQISAALSRMAAAMGSGGIVGQGFWSHRLDKRTMKGHDGMPSRGSGTPTKIRRFKAKVKSETDEWVDFHPTPTKGARGGLLVRTGSIISGRSPLSNIRRGKRAVSRSPGPLLLRRLKGKGVEKQSGLCQVGDEGDLFSPQTFTFDSIPRRVGKPLRMMSKIDSTTATSSTVPIQQMVERAAVDMEEGRYQDDWKEPRTIPGRLVHDLCVWLIIAMEWTVYVFVLLMKMGLDLQEGKQGIMEKNRNDRRRKRYYL